MINKEKTERFGIRLSVDEKKLLVNTAKQLHLSASELTLLAVAEYAAANHINGVVVNP
jgi:uncharacterized protein (DUF1778 family)